MAAYTLVCIAMLLATAALGYKPTQSDVDAFVNALTAWPKTDPNLATWKALWGLNNNANQKFCRNGAGAADGKCIFGVDNIVESFMGMNPMLTNNTGYIVTKWFAAENILWLKETMEELITPGGCLFKEDTPRILYYDTNGKIVAVHQYALPDTGLNLWLNAAMTGQDCTGNAGNPSAPALAPANGRYTPGQEDADAFITSLTAWPKTDPNLVAWKALWDATDPKAEFCRNGACTVGVDNIVEMFVGMNPMFSKNVGYSVTNWVAGENALFLKDTLETLVTPGGCQFAEDTPRMLYYNAAGKIIATHQLILPDPPLTKWMQEAMAGENCTTEDHSSSGSSINSGSVSHNSDSMAMAFLMALLASLW